MAAASLVVSDAPSGSRSARIRTRSRGRTPRWRVSSLRYAARMTPGIVPRRVRSGLEDDDVDRAGARAVELGEKHALPAAQVQPPPRDRQGDRVAGHGRE